MYTINDAGIITSPGKFEGEPEYVHFFWGILDEANCIEAVEELDRTQYRFIIDDDEIRDFPTLGPDALELVLWEDDQGFVHHEVIRGAR